MAKNAPKVASATQATAAKYLARFSSSARNVVPITIVQREKSALDLSVRTAGMSNPELQVTIAGSV